MADTEPSDAKPTPQNASAPEDVAAPTSANDPAKADDSLETAPVDNEEPSLKEAPPPKKSPLKRFSERYNVYMILFASVILMIAVIIGIAYVQSQSSGKTSTIKTQTLNQSTLEQLANSDATLGSSQYVLNVESSAIFAGQVILKQNVQIAGNLQVGGTASFNNVSAAGTGQFGQATITNNLTVGGTTSIQGSATISKSLQVGGGGNFDGSLSAPQITTSILSLNGDLVLQHHVSTSGPVPSRTNGAALGNAGTASVSGTDTAGTISINTGTSPGSGCFISVTFTTPFNEVPHILVTPIGSAAGGISYYVTRTTTGFSLCDAATPPSGSGFSFDYFVID